MYILGLDTTQAACSAAIFDSETQQVCGSVWREMPRGHAEHLPQIINEALEEAQLSLKDIGKLSCTVGPGTFSGVRIGLSAARGFSLALGLPLCGVSSLETIAASAENFQEECVIAAFDARRDEIYIQIFDQGKAVTEPQLLRLPAAAELIGERRGLVIGTAGQMLGELCPKLDVSLQSPLPDARIVARLGAEKSCEAQVQPLYLRRADAKSQTPLLQIKPSATEIKPIETAHLQELAAIHEQGFSNNWNVQSIAASAQGACATGLVCLSGNVPVGFLIFRDGGDEREILTIAVALDARRRNVAGQLLAAMFDTPVTGQAISRVFLEVSEDNEAGLKLYQKFGFSDCGRRTAYYTGNDGQKHDAIIMQKSL